MKTKPTRIYTYRGLIERGNGKGWYSWFEGYSATGENGGVMYPWMTFRECQREARADGVRAKFYRPSP